MFEGLQSCRHASCNLPLYDIILKCMYTVMYSFLIRLPRNGNDEQIHYL